MTRNGQTHNPPYLTGMCGVVGGLPPEERTAGERKLVAAARLADLFLSRPSRRHGPPPGPSHWQVSPALTDERRGPACESIINSLVFIFHDV